MLSALDQLDKIRFNPDSVGSNHLAFVIDSLTGHWDVGYLCYRCT